MNIVVLILLLVVLGYLLIPESMAPVLSRKRMSDYVVDGVVYQDIPSALKRGVRLLEVHVYSDEQDYPVVAKHQINSGYDFADDNVSFEQVCIDIANDAFPSKEPMILSIVPHTEKSIVMDRVCEHLQTITRRHLTPEKDIHDMSVDMFANKLILVSGGNIHGTKLESIINLNWNDSNIRRLTYTQAVHSRDEEELKRYTREFIVLVAPEERIELANPQKPKALGCQWNLMR